MRRSPASCSRSTRPPPWSHRSIFFAAAIIIAGFIPLFTLSGVEGHIFGPMAKTYAYALAGGLIATFTVDAGAERVAAARARPRDGNLGRARAASASMRRCCDLRSGNKLLVVSATPALLVVAGLSIRALGLEFLPKLEEGNLWVRANDAVDDLARRGQRLRQPHARAHPGFPEVEIGGVAAWPAGRRHRRRRVLQRRVLRAAQACRPMARGSRQGRPDQSRYSPGCRTTFRAWSSTSRNISQDNVAEAVSGRERRELDQALRQRPADHSTPPTRSRPCWPPFPASPISPSSPRSASRQSRSRSTAPAPRATASRPATSMRPCRRRSAARPPAISMSPAATVTFPIMVRLAPQYRQTWRTSATCDRRAGPNGVAQIPLSEVATVKLVSGAVLHLSRATRALHADQVQRARPRSRQRDLGGAAEGREAGASCRPALGWNGSANSPTCRTRIARLQVVVPISLALIALLLWINFGSGTRHAAGDERNPDGD